MGLLVKPAHEAQGAGSSAPDGDDGEIVRLGPCRSEYLLSKDRTVPLQYTRNVWNLAQRTTVVLPTEDATLASMMAMADALKAFVVAARGHECRALAFLFFATSLSPFLSLPLHQISLSLCVMLLEWKQRRH